MEGIRLVTSVQSNDISTVRELLERGQNQDMIDSSLCWAARMGSLPLVELLLNHGADVNAEVWGGFTPIIWSTIFSSNTEVLNLLIISGGDVNRCSKTRKQTALHAAVIKGDNHTAELLIESGAYLDVQDYLGKTPLLHAVQRNLFAGVKMLIKHNCNVNIPGFVNGTSLSPLLVALVQNNLEVTKVLILAGAKFETTTIYQTYTLRQYYRTVEDNLNIELRPIFLKQQCRVCIRNLLKPQFLQKLSEMQLPKTLRDFLSLEELDKIDSLLTSEWTWWNLRLLSILLCPMWSI